MARFLYFIINLVVPGSGLVALGYWRLALVTQFFLMAGVGLLCWSRLVFEPFAIRFSLILILVLYIATCGYCLLARVRGRRRHMLQALAFALVAASIFSTGFIFKDRLLGIQIFFVPSMSMYPALKPGQFILVDTWAYRKEAPEEGAVVVLLHEDLGHWLVKRIATWPGGELRRDGLWYLLGDNSLQSSDSRIFGGFRSANIVGQAKLVLFGIDVKNSPLAEQFLLPVR